MAGPYYVDSNAAFAANLGNTGLSAASPWGGAGGLQKALLGWAAGETIYLIAGGTATLSQIWKVTGTLTGSIAAGETVAQGSNTGVAIIAASGVTLFVSSLTGFSASGTITGSGGGTMVYSGGNITQPGLGSFGGGTLAAGRCKIIGITYIGGVELNDHLTQVDINAASCTYGINANDWLHLENLSFRNGVSHLLNGNGKSYCRLINVKGTNAGAGTFYNWYTSSFDRCGSDGAHTYGFYVREYSILSD